MVIGEKDAGRTIELPVGTQIEISLPENPTTGFRWRLELSNADVCTIVRDEYSAPSRLLPGAPGAHSWQLRAIMAGECDLQLSYRRRAPVDAPPARRLDFHFRVIPPANGG
jgi:inhibitor of cysteine peptidase